MKLKSSRGQWVKIYIDFVAAGKSHFVKSQLLPKGYVHVNRVSGLSSSCFMLLTHCALNKMGAI